MKSDASGVKYYNERMQSCNRFDSVSTVHVQGKLCE